jgi:hypothetical protein
MNLIQKYLINYRYNPYVLKVINMSKINLIEEYIKNCEINESHDTYIFNIIEIYNEILYKELIDNSDLNFYFKKIDNSLNIENKRDKINKSILRLTVLDKIISIKNKNGSNTQQLNIQLQQIIDKNKIDKIIIHNYINMIKNNYPSEKIMCLENIIKYFNNFNNLSKELIKLILPKYFMKENIKYYQEIISRINSVTNRKLGIIDTIIDSQKDYSKKLGDAAFINTSNYYIDPVFIESSYKENNETKYKINSNNLSIFNIDNKYFENDQNIGKVSNYSKELIGLFKFTSKLFDQEIFGGYKKFEENGYLSNGKIQILNTVINTNLILINALLLFNPVMTISKKTLQDNFSENLIDDIINTFEYYNIAKFNNDQISINVEFFEFPQTINMQLIKKVEKVEEKIDNDVNINKDSKNDVIESYIIKTIKTNKIHKNDIHPLVESKCRFKIDQVIFDQCMKRLFDLDYYTFEDDYMIYVP